MAVVSRALCRLLLLLRLCKRVFTREHCLKTDRNTLGKLHNALIEWGWGFRNHIVFHIPILTASLHPLYNEVVVLGVSPFRILDECLNGTHYSLLFEFKNLNGLRFVVVNAKRPEVFGLLPVVRGLSHFIRDLIS